MRRLRGTVPAAARRGFSLIEVLAALVVFSVALIGFVQNMGDAARSQATVLGRQRARLMAQNVLEEMRFSGAWEVGSDQGQFEGDNSNMSWATSVQPYEDTELYLYRVVVTISWNDGIPQEYQLETLMAEPPETPETAAGASSSVGTGANSTTSGAGSVGRGS